MELKALYLQWGQPDFSNIKDEIFHILELDYVINKLIKKKTPGPDQAINELFIWLNRENRLRSGVSKYPPRCHV